MPAESVQMQLVRRYTRILRERQSAMRGPRVGATDRREAAREAAEDAATRAIQSAKRPAPPAASA